MTAERALTGTTNQIIITDNGANSTVILSAPQNLHTGASPLFASLILTNEINVGNSTGDNAGDIRFVGDDFEGNIDNTSDGWRSLITYGYGYADGDSIDIEYKDLIDTPSSYVGAAEQLIRVNSLLYHPYITIPINKHNPC